MEFRTRAVSTSGHVVRTTADHARLSFIVAKLAVSPHALAVKVCALAPTPAWAHALTALAIGACAVGNLLGGALAAHGARPSSALAWAFGASAVLALVVAAAPLSPAWRFGLVVAFAVVSGIVPPALFAEAPSQAPHPAAVGVTLGMMMQGNNLGLVAGPAAGASLTVAGGWPALGVGVAAAACTAVAVACWLLPRIESNVKTRFE